MNRTLRIISLATMMAILLAPALAQQSGSSSTAKPETAATTGTQNRVAKFVAPGVIGDSYITEDKFGKVGIGTALPTSPLTVQGMIEMTLGGLKFPDGSVQTSAAVTGLQTVFRDLTLKGNGTSGSPLGVSLPLFLNGAVSGGIGVINATSTARDGRGILAQGGPGGEGVVGRGGDDGIGSGGDGVRALGGDGVNGGGNGLTAIGGSGVNNSGGQGLFAFGGIGRGAGESGGFGILAEGGPGFDGATKGLAGQFVGDVQVTGKLSKGGGSFKIDHPLDPENKYLSHSFVESPDMMNIYNGNITTDHNGLSVVELPDYFESLNRDFRYQLTVVGQFAQAIVAEEVKDNRFTIQTSAPGVKVSWQVTGVRQDAWANQNRIKVEEVKSERERGHYLHPEAFGKTEEIGLASAHRSEQRQIKQTRKQIEEPKQ
jgi:hypothetical protein